MQKKETWEEVASGVQTHEKKIDTGLLPGGVHAASLVGETSPAPLTGYPVGRPWLACLTRCDSEVATVQYGATTVQHAKISEASRTG